MKSYERLRSGGRVGWRWALGVERRHSFGRRGEEAWSHLKSCQFRGLGGLVEEHRVKE